MVRIASLNVRGIADYYKRRKLFHYFHIKELDVVMLQETHMIKNKANMYKSSWGGNIYHSHGESNARGVATLISKRAGVKVKKAYKNSSGRILILDVEHKNLDMTLCNVYAPNDDNPSFYVELFQMIEKAGSKNIILGGDFNLVLDLDRDKKRWK